MSEARITQDGLTRLICDLVAIRSVNRGGRSDLPPSSAGVVAYLERWFHQHGIATSRGAAPNGEENLIATLPGPAGAPTILFDAHTDTVPADDWADRAFTPQIRDGRLYGRGSCDTKAAMAAMMLAMAEAAAGPPLPSTIVFVASADEEFGRTGVAAFLDSVFTGEQRECAPPPLKQRANLFAVVGEPTCCELVIACKGAARWDIVTSGKSAHTSTPNKGLNAITRMAAVVAAIDEYSRTVLAAKSHPLVDPATWTASLIAGGTAINVVPDSCRLGVDLRTMPQEDPRAAMRDAQQFLDSKCGFPLRHEDVRVWSGADVPPDHAFVRHCAECRGQVLADATQPKGVNYGCHASDYGERGIPAVVLGPGDIANAHAIDEYVDLASPEQAARIYLEIMRRESNEL